jgi:ABC-2 type transport system permease protein
MKINHLLIGAIMELRRIYHDRRRMLVLVLGPLGICLIFGLVFFHNPKNVDLTLFVDRFENPASPIFPETAKLIETIDRTDRFAVTTVYSLHDAYTRLKQGRTRAVVVLQESKTKLQAVRITIDVTDRILHQIIQIELPQVLNLYAKGLAIEFLSNQGMSPQQALQLINPFGLKLKTNEWRAINYFDLAASGVMILFIMGICLLMSVTALTAERTIGTFERILASPYKSSEIILGKLMAYTVLAGVVSTLVILSLKLLFNILLGNLFLVFLVSLLTGCNAVALGLLVSAVTNTELESVIGGLLCWFQGMMLMGFTWPLETMHPVMAWMSRLNPFYYALQALRHVNLNHWGLGQIGFHLVILLGAVLFQSLLAIRFLRRDRG